MSRKKVQTIIWAVDPTQEDHNLPQVLRLLRLWSEKLSAAVQPVSVFSRSLFNFPVEYSFHGPEQLSQVANKLTSKFLADVKATDFLPPKLLYISSNSHRHAAMAMADHAFKMRAQMIVVNSGLNSKWHLFSRIGFTETLITTSRIPVLAINQRTRVSMEMKTVLFPTDFSRESKVAFLNLQPWLKRHDATILIYNQVETPNLNFTVFDGGWMNLNVEQLIKEIENTRRKASNEWMESLQGMNVKASVIVERQQKGLEADIIACSEKNNTDLIALVNHSGTLKQTLLGSVAREVVARATCPVLVFHDPLIKDKKSMSKNEEPEGSEKQPPLLEWSI